MWNLRGGGGAVTPELQMLRELDAGLAWLDAAPCLARAMQRGSAVLWEEIEPATHGNGALHEAARAQLGPFAFLAIKCMTEWRRYLRPAHLIGPHG